MIKVIEYYAPEHPDGYDPTKRWTAILVEDTYPEDHIEIQSSIINYDERLGLLVQNISEAYPCESITIIPYICDVSEQEDCTRHPLEAILNKYGRSLDE